MAVALGLQPARALLNDQNEHVINFYSWLQRGELSAKGVRMVNREDQYYSNRRIFNDLVHHGRHHSSKAAALFYYLNRTGYNGLCRFSKRGDFNVPFGRYESITYANREIFDRYVEAMRGWEFTFGDFRAISLLPDDFVYADPPYDEAFSSYSKKGFSWDDQVELVQWLAKHSGPVVASNHATPRILDAYRSYGFQHRLLDGPRRISCTGDRQPAAEILAWKNL